MSDELEETSNAVTRGIRVFVRSHYVPDESLPLFQRYVFAYTVRIENRSGTAVQLLGRHWTVRDCLGKVEEVKGAGVIGRQPLLHPGQHFEYSSRAVLSAPRGEMWGTYRMHAVDGRSFHATIAPFLLKVPYSLN
jgi:ApaG protein